MPDDRSVFHVIHYRNPQDVISPDGSRWTNRSKPWPETPFSRKVLEHHPRGEVALRRHLGRFSPTSLAPEMGNAASTHRNCRLLRQREIDPGAKARIAARTAGCAS